MNLQRIIVDFALSLADVEDRLHLEITQILFGYLLDLDIFLALKNANLFVFSSLNRNFALYLQRNLTAVKFTAIKE